jgi:hypothetical protein
VGKALQTGEATALRRSGIVIDQVAFKSASAAERVTMLTDALQAQGGDAAVALRQQLPGAIMALNTELGNLKEEAGAVFKGPFKDGVEMAISLTQGVRGMIHTFNEAPESMKRLATGLSVLAVGGAAAFAFSLWRARKAADDLGRENAELFNTHLKGAGGAHTQAAAEERRGRSAG